MRNRFIPAGAGNTDTHSSDVTCEPVYPRWRGEHPVQLTQPIPMSGLSPLARGTHPREVLQTLLGRFIPAGAGNTRGGIIVNESQSVYPRWRGEHPLKVIALLVSVGLSPLARGTH